MSQYPVENEETGEMREQDAVQTFLQQASKCTHNTSGPKSPSLWTGRGGVCVSMESDNKNMAEEVYMFEQKYKFGLLSNKKFKFMHDPQTSGLLMKWSMLGRISAQAFYFDLKFQPYKKDDFVLNFFQDDCVKNNLKVLDSSNEWKSVGKDITRVEVEVVPCTKTSVDIFDPIFSHGLVHPNGNIVRCYHDVHPDFDELRMMLMEEGHYDVIGPCERQEFLFRLFKHIVLGGELCQYENIITLYIETAKMIYKELLSVQKDSNTKQISISSTVLKVTAYDDCGLCYPSRRHNEQTFAYLCIDPFRRYVYVLYHSFGVGLVSDDTITLSCT